MTDESQDQVGEDIQILTAGFKLLELDYLGGSGSRGYGKVSFNGLKAETVYGDYDANIINAKLGEEV